MAQSVLERNPGKESPDIFSKFNPLNTETLSVRIDGCLTV